ncbi:MAG TPA: RusA family crossover junction endodeoxyribonuclease [Chthonomonadaceae bacterium]|nr:RusA family crossover junction endodeoxyribonuclease [Chthonomonadaceae bacterium]
MAGLPFEFIIDGPPISQQARSRAQLQTWKSAVRAEAMKRWPVGEPPVDCAVSITIVYYHDGPTVTIDDDNMAKPIRDALNGLVYRDDNLITDSKVRKTDVNGLFYPRGMSDVLASGFVRNRQFVYVRVEFAPSHERLL